jgi:hypothetical protein
MFSLHHLPPPRLFHAEAFKGTGEDGPGVS